VQTRKLILRNIGNFQAQRDVANEAEICPLQLGASNHVLEGLLFEIEGFIPSISP
jgi:hypothetical protein